MRNTSNNASMHIILLLSIANLDDKMPSVNPKNSAPQSPINIFAWGKFLGKNPKIAPSSKSEHNKTLLFRHNMEMTAKQSVSLAQTPPASPSSPSSRLVALVIKIIQTALNIPSIADIL